MWFTFTEQVIHSAFQCLCKTYTVCRSCIASDYVNETDGKLVLFMNELKGAKFVFVFTCVKACVQSDHLYLWQVTVTLSFFSADGSRGTEGQGVRGQGKVTVRTLSPTGAPLSLCLLALPKPPSHPNDSLLVSRVLYAMGVCMYCVYFVCSEYSGCACNVRAHLYTSSLNVSLLHLLFVWSFFSLPVSQPLVSFQVCC